MIRVRRNWSIVTIALVLVTMVLGACVVPTAPPAVPTPEVPAEEPAAEEAATPAPAEEAMPALPKILAVEKTLANEHWQTMAKGYEDMAKKYGLEIEVASVPTEADTAAQLALVESALGKGFDAIAVSPITPNNLNPALAKASEMGIPIINVDELIPEDVAKDAGINITTRIASNNYYAGVLAAQHMIDNLPAGAKVAVLEGIAGNSSGTARRDGFTDTATAGGLEIVASQPADWDRAKANSVTTNILQANPDVQGIYFANDTMALGGAEAVTAAGKEGQIILIGTDAIPEALDAVKQGRLTATIAQYPYEMAALALESAIRALEGRPVAPKIDAPIGLLLQEDIP